MIVYGMDTFVIKLKELIKQQVNSTKHESIFISCTITNLTAISHFCLTSNGNFCISTGACTTHGAEQLGQLSHEVITTFFC